ncbi:unnamed protein product [Cunninghamella echinulata]
MPNFSESISTNNAYVDISGKKLVPHFKLKKLENFFVSRISFKAEDRQELKASQKNTNVTSCKKCDKNIQYDLEGPHSKTSSKLCTYHDHTQQDLHKIIFDNHFAIADRKVTLYSTISLQFDNKRHFMESINDMKVYERLIIGCNLNVIKLYVSGDAIIIRNMVTHSSIYPLGKLVTKLNIVPYSDINIGNEYFYQENTLYNG